MTDLPQDPLSELRAELQLPRTPPSAVSADLILPFDNSKAASASVTVWSGIATILSSFAIFAMVMAGLLGPDAIGPALVGLVGGVGTIIGRWRARTTLT